MADNVLSLPSNANVASNGGDIVVPVTATRMGCATFPIPTSCCNAHALIS